MYFRKGLKLWMDHLIIHLWFSCSILYYSQMWSENIVLDFHKNKVLTFYNKLYWVFLRPNKVNIVAIKISKNDYQTLLAFSMSLGLLHSPLRQPPLPFLFSLSLSSLAIHKKWNQKVFQFYYTEQFIFISVSSTKPIWCWV